MENFKARLKNHIEHVKNVREHCTTEETTKQALILPFLDILGMNNPAASSGVSQNSAN